MDTDRLFNSVVDFGLSFVLAYGIARLARDHRTGVRAGLVTGSLSAVASWVLWGRYEAVGDGSGAVEEEVVVPVEGPSTTP